MTKQAKAIYNEDRVIFETPDLPSVYDYIVRKARKESAERIARELANRDGDQTQRDLWNDPRYWGG